MSQPSADGDDAATPSPADAAARADAADVRADAGEARLLRQEETGAGRDAALDELADVAAQQNANIELLSASVEHLTAAVSLRPTRRETLGLVAKIGVVLAFLTLVVVGLMFRELLRQGDDRSATLDGVERTVTGLEANQADLDSLVRFVQKVQADRSDGVGGATDDQLRAVFEAVFQMRDLVCRIDDPIRAEACAETPPPVVPGATAP